MLFVDYIRDNQHLLLTRSGLLDLFTYQPNRGTLPKDPKEYGIYTTASEHTSKNVRYVIWHDGKAVPHNASKRTGAPFEFYDKITIKKGDIANYKGKEMVTTVGRYVTNYLLIASITDLIPYVNDIWDIGEVERQYGQLVLEGKIATQQYRGQYIDNGTFLSLFGELCIPTLTEKYFKKNKAAVKRLKELLEEHKDELDDPKVIAAIEAEIIAMDKEWLKGDDVERFLAGNKRKGYAISRKKMFGMVGGVEPFGSTSGTETITTSIQDGIDPKQMPAIVNEIRKGSYDRGAETAKGGEIAKFTFRATQDVTIIEEDCKTTDGIIVTFSDGLDPHLFMGVTVINKDGSMSEITEDNIEQYRNKTVKLRSPATCKTKDGFCFKCFPKQFKTLNITRPGTQSIDIGSKFMNNAMQSMHGTVLSTKKINVVDFII